MDKDSYRTKKVSEVIAHAAAEFIQRESNNMSMITVTSVKLSSDFQKGFISVTVFPEDQEPQALSFLKRNLSEFRDFIKSDTRLQHIPWFDFVIDQGEKNRQRIDEISHNI